MVFAGARRLLYYSAVVLLIISVLQIWVCCSRVGALRIFPTNAAPKVKISHGILDTKSKQDLFQKYFGRSTFHRSNRTPQAGFEEAKRRVPSCPDPLHN